METITSRHNPLVAHLRRLASSGSYRRERGEFLCDSPKLLHEALLHGAELLTVAATRGMALRTASTRACALSRCRRT